MPVAQMGLNSCGTMADSGLENISFCYPFHTVGKVFFQRELFAIVPDTTAGRSANLGANVFVKSS